MKNRKNLQTILNDHLGCFGDFSIADPVCRAYCALSLRCAIENDQNMRLEILEELVSSEDLPLKMQ